MTFKSPERGPQLGAPPSLEFVAVDRLQVDPAYQRATDIAHLPCVVLAGIDPAGEARTFVDLNTRRQKLSEFDKFAAMLAAGDDDAKTVAGLLTATGWRIRRGKANNRPVVGDFHSPRALVSLVKALGAASVELALLTLRKAYPDTPVGPALTLLKALLQLQDADADHRAVLRVLSSAQPGWWLARGETLRHQRGLSTVAALAVVIREAAAPKPPVAPASPRPASRPAAPIAVPQTNAFGSAGKGWCGQCEQLVTRESASACRSQFCAMKVAA